MSIQPSVNISLKDLAVRVGGTLQGNGQLQVSGLCALDDASPGSLTFIKDAHAGAAARSINQTNAGAYLVHDSLQMELAQIPKNLIFVKDPFAALVGLVPLFRPAREVQRGVHPKADVHPTAKLGKNVSVGAFCSVGEGAVIGDNTVLHPQVTVYGHAQIGDSCIIHAGAIIREDCVLGNNCTVQPGAVVGSDGFGYVPDPAVGLRSIPQVGGVRIADCVDIGANSCVDRATLGNTALGHGTKLDNLVQVGHNVRIGKFSLLCGQVGIGGSSTIGDQVVLGGNAGVGDHISISSGARIAAKSGIVNNIDSPGDYAGYPHVPANQWLRNSLLIRRLPEIFKGKAAKKQKGDE